MLFIDKKQVNETVESMKSVCDSISKASMALEKLMVAIEEYKKARAGRKK